MKNTFNIYHDLTIHSTIHAIYSAITEPQHLINWWPKSCSGSPKEGAQYNFYFSPEYNWYGEVVHKDAPYAFYIKMTTSDDDWNSTTFGFDLEQKSDHVLIKFSHKGWPRCNAHFRRSSYCWAILLSGLKDYIEKGIIIPYENRE